MKPLHFLGMLTAAFLFSQVMAVTLAHAETSCTTYKKFEAEAHVFMPQAIIADMTEAQSQIFLKVWNAVPPETNLEADQISVVSDNGKPNVLILFFNRGCMARMVAMPHAAFNLLVGQAL